MRRQPAVGGPGVAWYRIVHLVSEIPPRLRPGRLVAVKVIDPSLTQSEEIVARFRQEQALGVRLRHPNLVAVYEAGRASGRPYLVMEFVEDDNLDELLGRCGPLPVADACEVTRQAALGLKHLHEHSLVHRDVKPSKLMLTTGGEVKVLDLGLARQLYGRGRADAGRGPRGPGRQPRRRGQGRAALRGRCRFGGPGRGPVVPAA